MKSDDAYANRRSAPAAVLVLALLFAGCHGGAGEEAWTELGPLPEALADSWISRVPPERMHWSWGDSVLMYAMVSLHRETGRQRYFDYARAWIDHHLAEGFYVAYNDNCPPGIALVHLYEQTGEEAYLEAAGTIVDYLFNVAQRTSDGGINHMGWLSDKQLWVDSLFMFGIFLAEMGRVTGGSDYFDEMVRQVRIFTDHLLDPEFRLYRHMWDDPDQQTVPEEPVFWARGNAWVLVSLVELLERLPADHEARSEMEAILVRLAAGLSSWQDETGLWWTVLNRPGEAYTETSASALIAYGMAKGARLGLLDSAFLGRAQKAMRGLAGRLYIDCRGLLHVAGTSYGTGPGGFDNYANVLVGDDVDYGVGALILAANELRRRIERVSGRPSIECSGLEAPADSAGDYVERGKSRLETGDLIDALFDFEAALVLDGTHSEGHFGAALAEAVFLAAPVYDLICRVSVWDVTLEEILDHLRNETLPAIEALQCHLYYPMRDPGFSFYVDRLVILEFGGNNAFGPFSVGRAFAIAADALAAAVHEVIEWMVGPAAFEQKDAEKEIRGL